MDKKVIVCRQIPRNELRRYLNAGFTHEWHAQSADYYPFTFVTKSLITGTKQSVHTNQLLSIGPVLNPHASFCVANINRPLGKYENAELFNSITVLRDEKSEQVLRGLQFNSLRRIQAQLSLFSLYKFRSHVVDCQDHQYILRGFANFDNQEQQTKYEQILTDLKNSVDYQRDQQTGFEEYNRGANFPKIEPSEGDFWWDLDNDVMFSFDKNFMSNLEQHLKETFRVLDTVKE